LAPNTTSPPADKKLENAFSSLEGQTSVGSTSELESLAESASSSPEADLLARTAGLLVQSVDHETNPKFANSQFLGLMKQLRDRKAIVEGNDIVAASPEGQMRQTHTDLKGKGKAVPFSPTAIHDRGVSQSHVPSSALRPSEQATPIETEDANDAYFRQDNEDYIDYWKAHHAPVSPLVTSSQDWQQLHHDWETFEATTTGVKRLAEYQFQPRNPYLLEERSHNHALHGGSIQRHSFSEVGSFLQALFLSIECEISFLQSVLEIEAVVQRDPSNARAWYELGVKQQENEREQQAISALQRSLELDPTHLPSWLALAISYTNEGDRRGTYEAIQNWIKYNEAYRDIVDAYQAGDGGGSNGTDLFQKLIGCLIAMARGISRPGTGGDDKVDADVQIALAVLLNTNEVL
jgi:peroxin-5